MNEETAFDRDYFDQTVLNPLGLAAILVLGIGMLFLPRRYAVWPMIIMGCLVSPAQRIAVFSLNFDLMRLLVLFGTVRVLSRSEWRLLQWHAMDTLLVGFALVGTVVYILQFGTAEAIKFKLGVMYDILGMYFLFRCLVRSWDDIARVATGFAVVSMPVAMAFIVERATRWNMFAIFGGVREITWIRDGRMRCQGAYAHPILAGCYWAGVLPLMAALWWRKRSDRRWAVIGVVCGLVIIVLCASSTPAAAVGFGILGAAFFVFRRHMRGVRWTLVAAVIALHLVMKQPVWHLISRIDFAGGSTGYYRFTLIDATIQHFSEWWLLGIQSNAAWGKDYGHYVDDITNQYVLEGLRGGIWALTLFVLLIAAAFGSVGRRWRLEEGKRANLIMSWALGVSLFVHCVIFIGVSYFGQITMLWYLTLAMIGSLAPSARRSQPRKISSQAPGVVSARIAFREASAI